MRVCVIGGSGFIGTQLCCRLHDEGLNFYIIDKIVSAAFPEQTKIADVRSVDALWTAIEDDSIIVNLAAEHLDNVVPQSLYGSVNVDGAKNICNIARNKNVTKIVFTSSVAVYGLNVSEVDEGVSPRPFNAYGESKLQAESVYKDWYLDDEKNRSLTIIRPAVVFGEGNRGNVYNLINKVRSKWFIMIGNGANKKSMAYVQNLSALLLHVIQSTESFCLFNYADKPDYTMRELVTDIEKHAGLKRRKSYRMPAHVALGLGLLLDMIGKIIGKQFGVSAIRIRKFCATSVFNSNSIPNNFEAPFTIGEGLERTISSELTATQDEEITTSHR